MWWPDPTSPGPFFFWALVCAIPALIVVLLPVMLTDGAQRVRCAALTTFVVVLGWGLLTIPSLYRPTPSTYGTCGAPLRPIDWTVGSVDCEARRLVTGGVVVIGAFVLSLVAAVIARWSNRFGPRTDWSPSGWMRSWRM